MQRENDNKRLVDLMIEYLRAEGVEVIFGVPGGLLHPFFVAAEKAPKLRLIIAKHEEGAAFMADGYARTTGKLGVVAATSGPGATNLMTAAGVALSDGIPLLLLTGQAPTHHIGKGAAQETPPEDIDVVGMFRPVTKYSALVPQPGRFAHHYRRALRRALSERPGPVHLNVPVDFWSREVPDETVEPARYRARTTTFDRSSVKQAAEALVRARRPVILAGAGVARADAREELRRFAEQIRARVATSPCGKGVFPEDHPQSLGVLGFAGHPSARSVLMGDDVDALICVGTSLNETTTFGWDAALLPDGPMIHLDIDVDHIGRSYPVDIALVGHARTILTELYFHVKRVLEREELQSSWPSRKPPMLEESNYRHPRLRWGDDVPVTPERWRMDLLGVLPGNAIVFSDIGGHMLFNIHDLLIREGQEFHINLGFGSMGHGTVAPIGAALANADRPVIAIIGDACFTMNGMEMVTAVEYGIPVLWIVENNQMHGITYHGSKLVGGGNALEAVVYDKTVAIAEMARAMGIVGHQVDAPGGLVSAAREFFSDPVPTLIEVRVDADVAPPLEDRAQTIAGEAEAIGGFRR